MKKLVTPRAPLKMRLQNRRGAVMVSNKVIEGSEPPAPSFAPINTAPPRIEIK